MEPETKASSALILFGRPVRNTIPMSMGRYCPHNNWQQTLTFREQALARRHSREHEKWSDHTRMLPPLKVGDHVYVQNLVGDHSKNWERSGVITEPSQLETLQGYGHSDATLNLPAQCESGQNHHATPWPQPPIVEPEHTEPSSGRQPVSLLQDGMDLQPGAEQPLAFNDSPVTSDDKGLR
ncbi:hypothetical protein RRG08_036914 [Elysia crispata]|nr:hypothetical protein RRG08_036914 [Elysia crispata]